jgi:hypothetical protein
MNTQDKLNMASALGNTIAGLLSVSQNNSSAVQASVCSLITAMAAKAQGLLTADELKITAKSPEDVAEIVDAYRGFGAGIARELLSAEGAFHSSDCSTNNRGVPELLGKCDCSIAPCEHNAPAADCPCMSEGTRNQGLGHNMNCNFEHFLAYTGLHSESPETIAKIKIGFADQWRPCDLVAEVEFVPDDIGKAAPIISSADLVEYLSGRYQAGQIDHVVRVVSSGMGQASFYIRPHSANGVTSQFFAVKA